MRLKVENFKPLNIIIWENLLDANHYLEKLIKSELTEVEKVLLDKYVGLVEASIGRMVPIMMPEMQEGNILKIWVEEYDELPVDKQAFKGDIPEILNMVPFSPFEFYIQRKLFIHNMGHAMTAYLGNLKGYTYIWQAIKDPIIKHLVSVSMKESANALSIEHNYSQANLLEYSEDLIRRFANSYLGDTIERVGKDTLRKLSSNDRLAGAAKLCIKHGISPFYICLRIAAGLCFEAANDLPTSKVQNMIVTKDPEALVNDLCDIQGEISSQVVEFYYSLKEGKKFEDIIKIV